MTGRLSRQTHQHPSADDGAVAVLTAILAVVLFGFAALSVELGDMFSRDAAVQSTADLAAFAGGQDLPDSCAAFTSALGSLNREQNGVLSDTESPNFAATVAEMSDGDTTNGEIEILDRNNIRVVSCSQLGRRVRVTTPTRTINFPLASTLPGAPHSGTVQATGTVEIRSLDLHLLPMSIPASCSPGAQVIYARSGGAAITYAPPGRTTGPDVAPVVPSSTTQPAPATIVVLLTNLRSSGSPPAAPGADFDFHLLRFNGTTLRAPSTGAVAGTWVPGSTIVTGPGRFTAAFTVPLPAAVNANPGAWRIRGKQPGPPGTDRYTRNSRVGTFTVIASTLAGCTTPTAGVYGLLASPRVGGGSGGSQQARNFILGIDHDLFPVSSPVTDGPCVMDGNPYIDARLDDPPSTDGATCLDVLPAGTTAGPPTNGLINGVTGLDGRLVGDPGVSTSGSCRVSGDPDLRWMKNGRRLVDTALSCYLAPTMSLSDVANGVENSLTDALLNDPRFFVIPTTDTTFHPLNSAGSRFWPIKGFRGAFLTNEVLGGDATCSPDNGNQCNGLTFNGSQLSSVQAFTFPLAALPDAEGTTNGRAYIGGPRDLLLVE